VRALIGYHWPGNVRELRNFAERQSILNPGRPITPDDLPPEMRGGGMAEDSPSIREREEKAQLAQLLRLFDGNQSKVTRHLNIPLTTLRRKLKKYDLRH
jgi:transcriptional regulator of acetoin/glycerol metabolism